MPWSGARQMDEAIACYRQALALDPNYAQAHNNLGIAQRRPWAGRTRPSPAATRPSRLDARLPLPHTNLGVALRDKGRLDEAIACHRRAIALDPKCAGLNLGVALQGKGQLDEAIACQRQAIEADPKSARPTATWATPCPPRANWTRPSPVTTGPSPSTAPHRGPRQPGQRATKDKGRVDEAIASYHKAIEIAPKFAPAHYGLGLALEKKGRLDEAIACIQKALALGLKFARPTSTWATRLWQTRAGWTRRSPATAGP
ncbi:MAG: tetratricopeptide repeat protein [Gemmataceae bacterium]